MSNFFIIATPIGNLSDITYRAVETLKKVEAVFSENPRTTKKLLDYYNIKNNLYTYNQHSNEKIVEKIFSFLKEEKDIALVSEAGTPGISDPGSKIVSQVRESDLDVNIVPIPGPSALSALLSVSGLGNDRFLFLGFLPHKKGRQKILDMIVDNDYSVVLYESKHRFLKLLNELIDRGLNAREIIVGRELTKMNESIYTDNVENLLKYFEENIIEQKGEFSIIIKKSH
ncbi:16S rRNA (cytidine(1402)-2'-O)-methyltransferase [bacterium]|nr:16S rRNA (cytidine(1402)-2'-O)-methyltransferase [bacterium]